MTYTAMKMGAAAVVAIGLGACGVSVVGGNGDTLAGAGGRSAAVLGCISGAVETFAANQTPQRGIAADAQHVYWANDHYGTTHDLVRVSKADGAVEVLDSGPGWVDQIVLDEAHVYWSISGVPEAYTLFRVAKEGGASAAVYQGDSGFAFTAGDPDRLFILQTHVGEATTLLAVPKAGGTPTIVLAGASSSAALLAEDDTRFYWLDDTGGRIVAMPKAGGSPETIVAVGDLAYQVARILVDANDVFWFVPDYWASAGTFYRVSKAGGAATTLATVTIPQWLTAVDVAMDDRCLYWAADSGSVGAVRKDDGSAAVLGENAAASLVADESGLYLAAPAGTTPPPGYENPPSIQGAVQRIAR
jgi:sugar lactone lactonase YvrE